MTMGFGGVQQATVASLKVTPTKHASARIQNAIDVVAGKRGGIVSLAAGVYTLEDTIVVSHDRVRLVGDSRATVLQSSG